jgi:hypothetical protein
MWICDELEWTGGGWWRVGGKEQRRNELLAAARRLRSYVHRVQDKYSSASDNCNCLLFRGAVGGQCHCQGSIVEAIEAWSINIPPRT